MCDIGNIFDLVVILLLLVFDRECVCNRCGCKRSVVHPVRLIIFAVTTTVQWVIISQTDKRVFEDFTKKAEGNAFENGDEAQSWVSAALGFTAVNLIFIVVFLVAYFKPECFKRRPAVVRLIAAYMFMFVFDVYMLIFTIRYAKIKGEEVIEFSDFSSGFRSVVLFVSAFDVLHSSFGFISVCKNYKKIGAEMHEDRS